MVYVADCALLVVIAYAKFGEYSFFLRIQPSKSMYSHVMNGSPFQLFQTLPPYCMILLACMIFSRISCKRLNLYSPLEYMIFFSDLFRQNSFCLSGFILLIASDAQLTPNISSDPH